MDPRSAARARATPGTGFACSATATAERTADQPEVPYQTPQLPMHRGRSQGFWRSSTSNRILHMLTGHERQIDRLYGHGAGAVTDSHRGYMNFGLWDAGATDYAHAAERMV